MHLDHGNDQIKIQELEHQMIKIIGRTNCTWCTAAKNLLDEKNIPYIYMNAGEHISLNEVMEMYPGVKTVPIISVDGKFIGGYDDLKRYLEETSGGHGDGAL